VCGVLLALACERPSPPRGLILVSIDTLRADHLGTYGYDRPTSPQIDALAEDSIVFERMLAHAPNTPPSHMSLLTGLLPVEHGVQGWVSPTKRDRLDPKHTTFAEILQRAGFATAASTAGGWMSPDLGFDRGFDEFHTRKRLSRSIDWALDWLDARPEQRFFLFLHTYEVHAPYRAAPEHRALFVEAGYRPRWQPIPTTLGKVRRGEITLSDEDLRYFVNLYDAGIHQVDATIGLLVEQLAARHVLDETIVVVTSDHGEEFLEHGSTGHWQLFNRPNLHVPFIVRLPRGTSGGRRITEYAQHVDFVPTMLELLGLPPHSAGHGRSWAAAMTGGPAPPARPALAWSPRPREQPQRSVIWQDHQLILNADTGERLLFDLREDSLAQRDLAASSPERVADLESYWRKWEPREKDAWPERPSPATSTSYGDGLRRRLQALGYLETE